MIINYVEALKARILQDGDYYSFLLEAVHKAYRRIHAAVFIVDMYSKPALVRDLLDGLAMAVWRGVDVRLVIGKARSTPPIEMVNRVALYYAERLGLPVRVAELSNHSSLHSKYVLIDDDLSIVGSHNWSRNAFSQSKEMSVAIHSKALAKALSNSFKVHWETGLVCPEKDLIGKPPGAAMFFEEEFDISARALDKLIGEWAPQIPLTPHDKKQIRSELKTLAASALGGIVCEEDVSRDLLDAIGIFAIKAGMQKYINSLQPITNQVLPQYWCQPANGTVPLSSLKRGTYLPMVNINTASQDDLIGLPGIGPGIARSILDNRANYGLFPDVASLNRVPGIGSEIIEKILAAAFVAPGDTRYLDPWILTFQEERSPASYFKIIVERDGSFTERGSCQPSIPSERLVRTVSDAASTVKRDVLPIGLLGGNHRVLSLKHMQVLKRQREAGRTDDGWVTIERVALISNGAYLPFVKELLASAKKSILLVMFYARYENQEKYPTDELVAMLAERVQNGVDVRVILDRDSDESVSESSSINAQIVTALKSAGISVVQDYTEQMTHTKLVMVDHKNILIGSHNWTAGSFYSYDDKSIFVSSSVLGKALKEYYQKLWDNYTFPACRADLPLEIIYTLSPAELVAFNHAGIGTTVDLLKAAKTPGLRASLLSRISVKSAGLDFAVKVSDLVRIDGLPGEIADVFVRSGIDSVPELAKQSAEKLMQLYESKTAASPWLPAMWLEQAVKWKQQAIELDKYIQW